MADSPQTMPADIKDGPEDGSANEMEMKTAFGEKSAPTSTALEKSESLKEVTTSSKRFGMNEKGHFIRRTGISWPLCALFIVADMAGGGIVAVPASIQNLYFVPGVIFSFAMAGIAMYTCILLGKSWVMLQRRFPEYRDYCRQVYAEIGGRALGKWAKTFVSITIDVNQFGVCVIYLLLSAKSINDAILTLTSYDNVHYCFIILILAAILLPFTFLKSPEDFWYVTFGAMACSVLSVAFIIVGSVFDYSKCSPTKDEFFNNIRRITPLQTISALGTMVFSYGGHASFPVILHDMQRPSYFTRSSYMAYFIQVLLYIPMSIVASLTYGGHIKASIINSIQNVWVQQTINLLICLHCITAFLLVSNPLNQDIEERLKIPHHFGWKRCAVRTAVLFVITFFCVSVPNFGPVLDLVGASTTLFTVLIFPPIFYFYLNASGNLHDEKTEKSSSKKPSGSGSDEKTDYRVVSFKEMLKYNSKAHLCWGFFVLLLGTIICITASGSAIYDLSRASFEYPCYVQPFIALEKRSPTATYCCGPGEKGTVATQQGMVCLDGNVLAQEKWKKP